MRLATPPASSFEMFVKTYQFPDLVDVPYDSNWLVIYGRAEIDGRHWEFLDPCLLTNELLSLAEWFEKIAELPDKTSEIYFLEPNLRFAWNEGTLRICFDQECRPSWAPFDEVEEFYLDLKPTAQELNQAAASLHTELAKYPIRPGF